MGASQGKKKDAKKDSQVALDPESSAALGKQLAQRARKNGQIMPWNEDNDESMNDREGVDEPARQRSIQQPQDQGAAARPPPPAQQQRSAQDSFEELQRQIELIERQNAEERAGEMARRQNVSLDSEEAAVGNNLQGAQNEDDMFDAIVASLIDYTKENQKEAASKQVQEEDRQLKEVLALSKLENDKKTGKLNLDFLKKKNKSSPRGNQPAETPATRTATQPGITQAPAKATFVIPGPTGAKSNSNLPAPAMVTAVVNMKPIPELGSNKPKIIPDATLPSLGGPGANKLQLVPIEESKLSPRLLAAPLSLAPITSKSKAMLPPLTIPKISSQSVAGTNPFESKLSQIPNVESENETEFESHKTVMPRDNNKLDEVGALMGLGNERSMAELQTSMHSRSPGPTTRSKLNMAMEASSMMPAGSTYDVHQQSLRDENSMLGGLMLHNSPEAPRTVVRQAGSRYEQNSMTMKAVKKKQKDNVLDDYEDLLNTIEQETNQQEALSSMMTGLRNSQKSLTEGGPPKNLNASQLGTGETGNLRSMIVRKEDQPTIDFELQQEMIDFNLEGPGKPKQSATTKSAAQGGVTVSIKKTLNESSDFDLDDI